MSKFDKLKSAKQRYAVESDGFVIVPKNTDNTVLAVKRVFNSRQAANQYIAGAPQNKNLYSVVSKSVHDKAVAKQEERRQRAKNRQNKYDKPAKRPAVSFEQTKPARSILESLRSSIKYAPDNELPSKSGLLKFIGDNWNYIADI